MKLNENFYLDNNLTGDERIAHLKDRMRECQKVFFNLKSALVKIEKQRKIFLRKQKPILPTTTTSMSLQKYCVFCFFHNRLNRTPIMKKKNYSFAIKSIQIKCLFNMGAIL